MFRWVIRVRVTSKSPIRTWSNSRGEGKLFSMDLIDESGEIRCTAFRDSCDKFYDMIEVCIIQFKSAIGIRFFFLCERLRCRVFLLMQPGKVYYISRCTLKEANKQFNMLKHDYEMTMTGDTEIVLCHENNDDIPTLQFNFCPISQVENKEKNDLIGIVMLIRAN